MAMAKACLITVGMGDVLSFPRMYKVARTLRKHGYEVVALCVRHQNRPSVELKDGILIRRVEPMVRTRRKLPQLFLLKMLGLYLPMTLAALRERADVYHCFHFGALPVGAVVKMLRGRSIRLFYDGLEDYPYTYARYYSKRLSIPGNMMLVRLTWKIYHKLELSLIKKFVDFVFTVDSADGIPYKRYKAVSENVVIIQNVPEVEASRVDEDLKKELMVRYKGFKLVVYVGAIHRIRGCLNMIKAIKYVVREVPNAKLLMIGPITDEALMEEASVLIRQYHLEDNVEFLGFVPYDKLHTYLAICHIGLCLYLPYVQSIRTKGSSKLFLYMRAGLPIVASNFPGIRSIVEEAKCGILVDPTNVKEIANAIIMLLENPELAEQLGENGRKAVIEKYNWELEKEKIIGAYEQLGD